ncbi:hypothetical protein [Geodermatophilus maliterrae]|uniref:Uncharacterized protein n=1 Tax=Geodermatophilus maliterrae TaxID=3162531 RepID=A0ABV3XEZ8_9ACTN
MGGSGHDDGVDRAPRPGTRPRKALPEDRVRTVTTIAADTVRALP